MQFLYVVGLLMMLGIVGSHLSKEKARDVASESNGIAMQFAIWHRAAYDRCSKSACAGGTVAVAEVVAHLPVQMSGIANSPYQKGWFTTRYDPATRVIVSHLTAGFPRTQNVSFGTVATAMYDDAMAGQTSSAGVWSGTEITPLRPLPMLPGGHPPLPTLTVPPNFMGVAIPTGSPIIASRV